MSSTDKTYDVAVVGLGPTGLTLAHLLGRRGLSVLLLEREPTFYGNARAVYTDDEAMRVFQTAGVADGCMPTWTSTAPCSGCARTARSWSSSSPRSSRWAGRW